jgi:tetratricopeptide (TPR) repeat protein
MNKTKLEKLYAKGRQLLDQGNIEGAKEHFYKVLQQDENVYVRNNLALTYHLAGDWNGALSVLEPVLSGVKDLGEPNPFTFALASMIYSASGNEFQARSYLKQAIEQFNHQLSLYKSAQVPVFFLEYTIIIMRAAAQLKDHRRVYDLYRRWRDLHVSWEAHYLAAVACFNMRDYKKAIRFWEKAGTTFLPADGMSQVAVLVMKGEIPYFEMDYEIYTKQELAEMLQKAKVSEEYRRQLMKNGYFRMLEIDMFLSSDEDSATNGLQELINLGGEWGDELGRRVLNSRLYPAQMKAMAAQALAEKGVFSLGDPIPAVIDGKKTHIKITQQEIIAERDEKLDEIVSDAIRLKNEGKLEDAIKLLDDLMQKGQLYPPAMIDLANCYRLKDEKEKALELFKIVEKVAEDYPAFLFNYSALLMEMGNVQKAREYFKRIKRPGHNKEFEHKLKLLEDMINYEYVTSDDIMEYWQENTRGNVEKKAIPADSSLSRGLKNMPAQWLDGMCKVYNLKPVKRRREREKQLYDYLIEPKNLKKAVSKLEMEQKKLLKYLLERGGWSRLNTLTRKFGSMKGDGFFWSEQPPTSPLAVLWSKALIMIGRSKLKGQSCKIATIPVELRQTLKKLLD